MTEKAVKLEKSAKKAENPGKVPPYKEQSKDLLRAIYDKMVKNGDSLRDFSTTLGISYPHATALMAGDRWWAGTDRQVIEKLAAYLGKPVIQIYYWAGFLKENDHFFEEDMKSVAQEVYERAKSNAYTSQIMCSEDTWKKMPMDGKAMVTILLSVINTEVAAKHAENELSNKDGFKSFRQKYGLK